MTRFNGEEVGVKVSNKKTTWYSMTPKEKVLRELKKCKTPGDAYTAARLLRRISEIYKERVLDTASVNACLKVILEHPDMEVPNSFEVKELFKDEIY